MSFYEQRHVVPCRVRNGEILRISLVRYSTTREPPSSGLVLFCSHGNGGHKEQWIPMLKPLLASSDLNVAEAWAIDYYHHGDSLPYNKDVVLASPETTDLHICGESLFDIFDSGLIPWKNRHVVFIGHSIGTHPVVPFSLKYIRKNERSPFSTVIFIAPVLAPADVIIKFVGRLRKPTAARKCQWASRDEAEQAVETTIPWKWFDKEVKKLYLDYGMVHTIQGSQLKVPSWLEAVGYPRPHLGATKEDNSNALATGEGWRDLPIIAKHLDLHFVCGDRHDLVPEKLQIDLINHVGSLLRSAPQIRGGHLLPQENPTGCANAISNILRTSPVQSKL